MRDYILYHNGSIFQGDRCYKNCPAFQRAFVEVVSKDVENVRKELLEIPINTSYNTGAVT